MGDDMRLSLKREPGPPYRALDTRIGLTYSMLGRGRVLTLHLWRWRLCLLWWSGRRHVSDYAAINEQPEQV